MTATATPTRQRYAVDQAEILRTVQLLIPAGQVVEVRAPKARSASDNRQDHVIAGYFDNAEALAKAVAATITSVKGLYLTLNEFDPAWLGLAHNRLVDRPEKTIADANITRRRWMLVDLDPERPVKDISSTNAEHDLSLARAHRIAADLQAEGWPAPIIGDSGNGSHVLWAIDLPAQDGGLVQQCLQALAARYDDALVKVDTSVYNPARISKIYGSWVKKGDDMPDRPHRLARLVQVPDQVQVVTEALLAALAASRPQEPAPQRTQRTTSALQAFNLERWISDHLPDAKGPRACQTQAGPGQKWVLDCPWNGDHRGGCAWIVELGNGAISAGCQHQSCAGNDWASLRRKLEPGYSERADRRNGHDHQPPAAAAPEEPDWLSAAPAPGLGSAAPAARPVTEIIAALEALRPADGGKVDRAALEAAAYGDTLVADCATLSRAELGRVESTLRRLGLPQEFTRKWLAAVRETKRTPARAGGDLPDVIPYEADAGHIYKVATVYTEAGPEIERTVIADFAAEIAEEIIAEDGRRYYLLSGATAAGAPFEIEISAEKFADERALLATLDEAAGAYSPVRAKMAAHLRPAIKLLTRQAGRTRQTRRYDRTGWADGRFLIPGREPADTSISLPAKLAYQIPATADLGLGLAALDDLLQALDLHSTTVAIAALFHGPLAEPAGWADERFSTFIAGRTGSLKTTIMQTGMCIYGAFLPDSTLLKWGEGATRNSILHYATRAADLPMMLDNFKPNTGDGSKGFTNLVHNLSEGTDKDRMQRSKNELRDTGIIRCWPIFTGEDVPADDPATIARLLVVRFHWDAAGDNEHLTMAQAGAQHLPAVGAAWMTWLESEEGRRIAKRAGAQLVTTRAAWMKALKAEEKDAVNAARIACNLAISQLTFWVLRQHPTIGPIIGRYAADHEAGLVVLATDMAKRSKVAREAVRFLRTISELLSTGKCGLEAKGQQMSSMLADRRIGWRDPNDRSYYLLFDTTKRAVLQVLGTDGLGNLSDNALHAQLAEMGLIASHDEGRHLKKVRVIPGERAQWCLHLIEAAIGADLPDGEEPASKDGRNA